MKILFSCSYSDYDLEVHVYVQVCGFTPALPHLFCYPMRAVEPSNNQLGIYISVNGLWKTLLFDQKKKKLWH